MIQKKKIIKKKKKKKNVGSSSSFALLFHFLSSIPNSYLFYSRADRWISTAKYYCKFCKTYIADNKGVYFIFILFYFYFILFFF